MRSSRWLVALAVLLALVATPALAARGGNKSTPTIMCTQAGLEVTSVVAGSQFAILGEGFTPDRTVLVCLSGEYCRYSTVRSDGTFDQSRVVNEPGTYSLTVRESRNKKLDRSVLRTTGELTVTEAY